MVVPAIQLKVAANNGPFGHLLEDTRRILQNVGQWKTTFVRRDANILAHSLARLGLTLAHPVYWFEEPPDVIFNLLFEDNINR